MNASDIRPAVISGRKQDQHQRESGRGAEAVQRRLQEAVVRLHVEQCHAEYRAVGCDQGQEDAQHLVEHGAGLVHDHLGELHDHGNDQDKTQG